MIGIYKITNKINNKCYIGQSVDITRRIREHRNCKSKSQGIDSAIQKYGIDNFTFEIVEECTQQELNEKEIYWIQYYNSYLKGYNETSGGAFASHFNLLDKEKLQQIIFDLQNTQLSGIEISIKYNISDQAISDINTGRAWHNDNLTYPLRKKQKHYCIDCGCEISSKALRCLPCLHLFQQKCDRPSKETLIEEIATSSFVQVGQKYGVSDKAIVKWCIAYNLPSHKKEIVALYKQMNKQ